jgi:potassium-transporting ATPase potassium-binding subunit
MITLTTLLLCFVLLTILILIALPLGNYMAKVFQGENTILTPIIKPLENWLYRLCAISKNKGMDWKNYSISLILFSILSIIILWLIQIFQGILPLNQFNLKGLPWMARLTLQYPLSLTQTGNRLLEKV